MRIVNLTRFRELPPGTVFSKYQPCCFGELMMKGDTWEHDFLCQSLTGNIKSDSSEDFFNKCRLMEQGESVDLDFDFYGRDGLFEADQLFVVYEKKDLAALIGCLMVAGGWR